MSQSRFWSRHGRWNALIPSSEYRRPWQHAGTLKRSYTSPAKNILVHIPKCNIYRFGDSNISPPVFRNVNWTMKEGESWAVIGRGFNQKTALLQTLRGHMRIAPPPPGGLFPFLSDPPRDAHAAISFVSFAHRPSSAGSAFYDYTARYGAVREEDRITLRESMFGEYDFLNLRPKGQVSKTPEELAIDEAKKGIFDELSARLGLSSLLDLPLVALSNGQTRRARIVKAILAQPELLLLDEPLTGLDINSRPTLLSVLQSLHEARCPRIIIGLRVQDPIPDWISHLALVSDGKVLTGTKDEILETQELHTAHQDKATATTTLAKRTEDEGKAVVVLRNVNVSYGERKVLKSINWTIREGQRWHLQGANGSGKTTLLSLLTGDHPQSYTQRNDAHLELFAHLRPRIPTPHLRALIGIVSPELANAYPRRAQTTVWDVVGTGFDGTFVPGGKDGVGRGMDGSLPDAVRRWRVARVWEVLAALGPRAWASANANEGEDEDAEQALAGQTLERKHGRWSQSGDAVVETDEGFARRAFVDLSPGEQSVVLLMRALVGHPQLVFLDEVWAGMGDHMVRAARRYLREGGVRHDQAVVVVSHWEEEVPWTIQDGLYRFRLQDGIGTQL
ncbi:P-loop containing nucleoside triphosphate hydrolase protein [Boletus reticuloceps]|uniref:P-loop containing nucleoside triphosphate hydrolase protein n=1 Tax=Boletus reticuloceps TaxID=495285 RepID=A0A8I2Z3U5_9AGAM|nr:P-loop containing nucleoside triphosphate hydrolase protein [Boletus reticuloceps]